MQQADNRWVTLLLYGLGFLLFWEWLRPLAVITNTGNLGVFVMYTAFAFLLSYLRLPFWITMPAKLLAMLYALHSLFFFDSVFNPEWLLYLVEDTIRNVGLLAARDWEQLSDLFRSLLFFVLLWMVSYLMHYWLVLARKVFLFFLVTVLYVTVIDTFTAYDATGAIVRTVVIGFILLGVLRYIQIRKQEGVSTRYRGFPFSWAAAIIVILAFSTAIGFAAPKIGPQWPDPVPFIKSAAETNGNGTGLGQIQRIGYDSNDSHLGGPFVNDDAPLFDVTTEDQVYWRVETKSIYTGKGWEAANDRRNIKLFGYNGETPPALYTDEVKTREDHAKIKLLDGRNFPQLLSGGQLSGVDVPKDINLMMNEGTRKIRMVKDGRNVSLKSYGITFKTPVFTLQQLKKSGEDPPTIKDRYLQLPKSLPDRVRRLAKKVTAKAHNRYAKADAVEQYLHSEDFTYDTQNVAVPGKNDDYVAQFLFQSKKGYCDNFSSAMAVMLRTVGIPTRWVKGFTPGDYHTSTDDGKPVYEVTNANAHSWVEVYFPNAGWVPFEPTKGFTNMTDIVDNASDQNDSDPSKIDSTQDDTHHQIQRHDKPKPPVPEPKSDGDSVSVTGKSGSWLTPVKTVIMAMIVVLILAWIVYRTRRKWLPRIIRARFVKKNGDDVLLEAYERLLKLLPMYGLPRHPEETLREYAVSVDRELGTHEMKTLTASYEKARYRGDRSDESWQESKTLWEAIMKRLMMSRS